jgi:mono/diheme cytochrome c family protein
MAQLSIAAAAVSLAAIVSGSVRGPLTAQEGSGNGTNSPGAYYSERQAERGHALFNRHCGYCHSVKGNSNFAGGRLIHKVFEGVPRYPSVYYLFKRVEHMPAINVDSINQQERADIIAYLLQQNGLPAGRDELRPNYGSMRGMVLEADPGFVNLFNGRDFTGFGFVLGPNCRPAPLGCGKTDPSGVFFVKDGMAVTTGKIHGYMYTQKKYANFTLRVDQRIDVEWNDDPELMQDQTGILLFATEHKVFPPAFVEVEGRYYDLLEIGAYGAGVPPAKRWSDGEARRRVRKPPNEWNHIEVVSKDRVVKAYLNGTLVATAEHQFTQPGYIMFQSQGAPVQWRFMRIRED